MWPQFYAAVLAGIVLIYLPGVLFSRALGASVVTSVRIAPLLSLPAYCILAALVSKMGVWCSWAVLFAPIVLLSAVAAIVREALVCREKGQRVSRWDIGSEGGGKMPLRRGIIAVLYVAFGVLATAFVFLIPMGDPGLAPQSYDNCYHLNLPVAFVSSGNWSMFPADLYADTRFETIPPVAVGFYPAELHTICAMLISSLGVQSQVAQAALLAITTSVIFPLGIHAFLDAAFPEEPWVSVFGIVSALVLIAAPWQLIIGWPLPPNVLSYALVPSAGACFITFFASQFARQRLIVAFVFVVGLAALALAQPNGVFALAGILAPFLVYQAGKGFASEKLQRSFSGRPVLRVVCACACAAIVVAIWTLCFVLPPLQSVVWYVHEPSFGVGEGVWRVLTLRYMSSMPHLVPAFFVLVGVVYTIIERRHLWLTFSYLFAQLAFIASSALPADSFFRYYLSGFWYTDAFRLAGYAALTAIPLIALGLFAAHRALRGVACMVRPLSAESAVGFGAALLLVSAFGLTTYPVIFDDLRDGCKSFYNDPKLYTDDERAFVEKAKQLIEPGSLVLNDPFDGSALAYSLDGLNVYNRDLIGYMGENELQQSALLRTSLKDIEGNGQVQEAVADLGLSYVLVLDGDNGDSETRLIPQGRSAWAGIDEAKETPGYLTEVLRDGDMLLLKVN
ncbi:MAG: hypothetical protein E7Z99_07335 [Coriobacteriaceae bacterium]|nr:hypothetical protein [Coriobacteriaceae bacterium]